ALACATPLVTADTPAARELLVDGESALLVPTGDPAALAAAVRRIAEDAKLAASLSRGGRSAYGLRASEAVLGPRWRAIIDPILALFAPLWWIWSSPNMLLVVQAVGVGLGAIPVYWLARKHLRSARAGLGFALVYLAYPATGWLTLNEFHPVALATPLLLFA